MKRVLLLSISAIAALSMYSCKDFKTPGRDAEAVEEVVAADTVIAVIQPVKTMLIENTTIKRTVKLTASMVAEEETYLAPGIAGKIRDIKVDVNDRVKKGQVLVQMDKTQLSQTKIQYAGLKKDLARMDTLLQYGSITQQAYDQMKTQVSTTRVMLSSLEENTELRAPYSGVITGKYFNDGELFSPAPNTPAGKAAIVSIVKMDILKLYINISERYLPLVKEGQIASLLTEVYPADTFRAEVFRIYPTINAATRTFTVELHTDNPDNKLRPGMYSTITLEMGDRKTLLVPSLAVLKQTGTNNRFVFLREGSVALKKMVTLGERVNDMVEIISGDVPSGSELIYAGHINLMDGEEIVLVEE
jgi:membrane fusion protein, multidrug efflux system